MVFVGDFNSRLHCEPQGQLQLEMRTAPCVVRSKNWSDLGLSRHPTLGLPRGAVQDNLKVGTSSRRWAQAPPFVGFPFEVRLVLLLFRGLQLPAENVEPYTVQTDLFQ